jgi:hypothetical protein
MSHVFNAARLQHPGLCLQCIGCESGFLESLFTIPWLQGYNYMPVISGEHPARASERRWKIHGVKPSSPGVCEGVVSRQSLLRSY